MQKTRCYSELQQLKTFEERFEYLKLTGEVGIATFGFDRYLNQIFITLLNGKEFGISYSFVIMVVT